MAAPSSEDFGGQSFHDLDISAPAPQGGTPALRFESKAVEPGGGGATGSNGASPELLVTVSSPTKVGEGISAYFTYEVVTKTSLPQFQYGQFSVTRRFRDFDWLHSQLSAGYPGAILPPLPEKHSAAVSRMRVSGVGCSAEWLEQRRALLQRFLQRVAAHPMLHTAPELQVFVSLTRLISPTCQSPFFPYLTFQSFFQSFLETSDDSLESIKERSKTSTSSHYIAMLGDVKKGLLSSLSSVSTSRSLKEILSSDVAPGFVPLSDIACQQMGNYAAALEAQVSAVHKHSKKFIERHRALAGSTGGFASALGALSSCESEQTGNLSSMLSAMGFSMDGFSALYDEQAAKESTCFEEPMKDYIRMLAQCKQAISAREAALKATNNASAALELKREKLTRTRSSGLSSQSERVSTLQREVEEAEDLSRCAKQEYERVAARVDAEMSRFQREKLAHFKSIIVNFVSLQLEYSKRAEAAWGELLPQLEELSEHEPK